jgi:hypothetical protein
MERFEQTRLWQSTLAPRRGTDPESIARERLRTGFFSFRERARIVAAEIPRDLADFTVHDVSHMDALWEMAELITSESFQLTPTEAFVFGGAVLIHDLGLALASYPGGLDELRRQPNWADTLTSIFRQLHGRRPTPDELASPSAEALKEAIATTLRTLHGKRAERLAFTSWRGQDGNQYHLIEDPDLRTTFGRHIGLIAASHWWPTDQLTNLPAESGAPSGFLTSWTVDSLKLACLLRVADAAHLDARRAPSFLWALRQPTGHAEAHWRFQEKLYQPRRDGDRLVYTAKNAFGIDEADAWWIGYDLLRTLDRELRAVDNLLADMSAHRLEVHGVALVDEPGRLVKLIPTEGWMPVDARIKVSAVASLVSSLGGTELYGQDPSVPLRELIQNARDAVVARRTLEELPEEWGDVFVSLSESGDERWIEVLDTGVGMSAEVLTGPFLDFGGSFWGSGLMHKEFPGLAAKGFESTGRYGIGFFSAFTWGDRIQVITRR